MSGTHVPKSIRTIDQTRAMLDELMGPDRNLSSRARKKRRRPIRWDDSEVCQHFLCGWCPKRQFSGSKVDIGKCNKKHIELNRIEFQEQSKKKQLKYYKRYLEVLHKLENELAFRIRRSYERMSIQVSRNLRQRRERNGGETIDSMEAKIKQLEEEIAEKKKKKEDTDAMEFQLSKLKKKKETAAKEEEEVLKALEVCQTCGGLADKALELIRSHKDGKIHKGFTRMKEELEKCNSKIEELGGHPGDTYSDTPSPRRRRRRRSRSRSYSSSSRSRSSSSSSTRSSGSSRSRSRSRSYKRS